MHQRSDRRSTLESEKTGKTPSKSQRRNFYASSDRSHCTPPKKGEKKGNSTSPVGNLITKSLLVKPLISPVIYFVSFLTSFITFEPDIITVKLFINSHECKSKFSTVNRKSKIRERPVARNRYREQP